MEKINFKFTNYKKKGELEIITYKLNSIKTEFSFYKNKWTNLTDNSTPNHVIINQLNETLKIHRFYNEECKVIKQYEKNKISKVK